MIGTSELILILIIALILFGPNKVPELARSLGKAVGEFKKAQIEAEQNLNKQEEPMDDRETKIHNLAIEMGLDAQNKTSGQLIEEIRSKIKANECIKTAGA